MTALSEWAALREQIEKWKDEWDAGIVQIRLSDGRLMYIDDAVPDTRGDCPTVKPCPHVLCRHHLWRIDGGIDGTRAGRPGLSQVPRDERGLTLRACGDIPGDRAGTTLEARWLETPVPPSCALDEADKGPRTNEEIGYAINRHRTMVARVNRDEAMPNAISNAADLGMSSEELLRGLRQMGAGG